MRGMNDLFQTGKISRPCVSVFCCEFEIPQEVTRCFSQAGLDVLVVFLPANIAPKAVGTIPLAFDAYFIDGHFPLESTRVLVERLFQLDKCARVLVISEGFVVSEAVLLLQSGVSGLVTYAQLGKQLANAARTVANGSYWIPRMFESVAVDTFRASQPLPPWLPYEQLPPEDRELLPLLLENCSDEEIANRLQLSLRAVKFRTSRVLSNFNVGRRADLMLHWYQTQVLAPSRYQEVQSAD